MTCRKTSSRPGRLGNINPIPIGYGSRPRLRGPAHPARINLAQEPLDFRREGLSPSLSLLMSAFSLPMPPAHLAMHLRRPTERSATTTEDRNQKARTSSVPACTITPTATQTLQHLRDFLILISPTLPRRLVDIAEIMAIADPDTNLVAGPNRHQKKAPELRA